MQEKPENSEKKKPGRVPKSATGGRRVSFNLAGDVWEIIEAKVLISKLLGKPKTQTEVVEELIRAMRDHRIK